MGWNVWCYAIKPRWELTEARETQDEADAVRNELIGVDGYLPRWVQVRRDEKGPPRYQPSHAEIAAVNERAGAMMLQSDDSKPDFALWEKVQRLVLEGQLAPEMAETFYEQVRSDIESDDDPKALRRMLGLL